MRSLPLLLVLCAACAGPSTTTPAPLDPGPPDGEFARWFTGRALRFDYLHTGTQQQEQLAPHAWRLEGAWPGAQAGLTDDLDQGKYRFQVRDRASDTLLFSRGFCSIYGEWETTGEAKTGWRSFEESQRFPEPRQPVRVALEKRGDDGRFKELWSGELDPASRFVDRSTIAPRGAVLAIFENGPPRAKVDLLVVADGYTAGERGKFESDARQLLGVLFDTEPFRRRQQDFNARLLFVDAPESGISNPRKGVWRDSAFDLSFNAFDSDRYVLTYSDRALRDAAAQVPYDTLILLFNERKYGGGGIYNLWATVASDTEPAPYVFVHEFGHSFAGLADEYYSSQVAYEDFTPPGVEPWEPNATALLDPARLKWGDLVAAGTPLPTPWDQAGHDALDLAYQAKRKQAIERQASEEENEALMREIGAQTAPRLLAEPHAGKVGAFEGSMYSAKGLYRPEVDCIMFTRNPKHFCRVCERALERVIDQHTRSL